MLQFLSLDREDLSSVNYPGNTSTKETKKVSLPGINKSQIISSDMLNQAENPRQYIDERQISNSQTAKDPQV